MPCTRGTTAVSGMVVSLLFILVWLCKGAESGVRPGLSIDTTCLQRLDWGVSIVCRTRWKSAGNRLVRHKACHLNGRLNGKRVRGQPEREPLPCTLPTANGSLNGTGVRPGESCEPPFRYSRRTGAVSMTLLKRILRRANRSANTHDHVNLGPSASRPPLRRVLAPGSCRQRSC